MRGPQPFPERVPGNLLAELADQLTVFAERQPRLGVGLRRGEPLLLPPGDGRPRELLVGEVGQRRAAPQAQRLAEQSGPGPRLVGVLRGGDQVREPGRVHVCPQHVAGRLGHDQLPARRAPRRPTPGAAARPARAAPPSGRRAPRPPTGPRRDGRQPTGRPSLTSRSASSARTLRPGTVTGSPPSVHTANGPNTPNRTTAGYGPKRVGSDVGHTHPYNMFSFLRE